MGVFWWEKGVEDEKGYLLPLPNHVGELTYYRNRNVFDTYGNIIPPGKLVDILNEQNPHFRLQYSVASSGQIGAKNNGGQISGQRHSGEDNLDLSSMFYCIKRGKQTHGAHYCT